MPPAPRSVKIGADERTGWSSERPRREGERPRGPDLRTRCRVLSPSDRIRYSPGSLVVVAAAEPGAAGSFAGRVIEEQGAVLSMPKVRELLVGKVVPEEIEEKASTLLQAAVAKRLAGGDSVVVPVERLDPEERAPFVVAAAANRRPRHFVLVEGARDRVEEDDRLALNELRTVLAAGGLGEEGFVTALRLGGNTVAELKRIVFAPPPADD